MSTARSAAGTWVVAASLLIVALCWWWIVAMAGDMYGPMTGAAAWMMTRRWDWPHMALLFAIWSAMMVGMMLPSAVAAIVGYGRTQRGTPARAVAPTCAFVAAYVLVWMLFSLAATLAQRVMYELHLLLSPMMEPATTALAGGLPLAAGVYQLLPFKRTCLGSCRGTAAGSDRQSRPRRVSANRERCWVAVQLGSPPDLAMGAETMT